MSCCMAMPDVIGDMEDIAATYERLDRFLRFDQALTIPCKRKCDIRRRKGDDSTSVKKAR